MRIVQWTFIALFLFGGLFLFWQEWSGSTDKPGAKEYVLALTWMPAFCEGKPSKVECKSQHPGRHDSDNFSLHGLWPQPFGNFYCGVGDRDKARDKSGKWSQLPKLEMSKFLRAKLAEEMPGYLSNLHRHEWIKHGTCAGGITPAAYFEISLKLMELVNASQFAAFWRERIGKSVTFKDVKAEFEDVFGNGSGVRLRLNCRRDGKRNLISELHISLQGNLMKAEQLAPLVHDAKPLQNACKHGVIDPVGYQ